MAGWAVRRPSNSLGVLFCAFNYSPGQKGGKKPGSHMFHLVSRPRVGGGGGGEMLKFSRIVFLDGIQPRGHTDHTGLVIRFNISRQTKQIRGNKGGPGMDIAHVHN